MVAGVQGVPHRRLPQRQHGDARGQAAQAREQGLAPARHEEHRRRQHVEEVAVAQRAAAAVPVVGDQPQEEELRGGQRAEAQKALARARAAQHEQRHSQGHGEEVGHDAAEAPDPEIGQVAQVRGAELLGRARRLGPARGIDAPPLHARSDLVGAHPDAAVAEGHAVRLERELRVEGLALGPALVVPLAGHGPVGRVQQRRRAEHHGPAAQAFEQPRPGPVAAQAGDQRRHSQRQRHQHVGRLGVDRQAEQRRRQRGPAAAPGQKRAGDHAQVEGFGRQPHQVQRRHGAEDQHDRRGQRQRGHGLAAQLDVGRAQCQSQRQGVEQQQAARAEDRDQGRGRQRIGERLGVVDGALVVPQAPHPREAGRRVEAQAARGALQKDALRAAGELAPAAEHVARLVAQVVVFGQAVGHGVVRGPVAPELAAAQPRQVGAEGGRAQADHQQAEDDARGALAHSQPASRYDAAVRATPSSSGTRGA